MALCRSFDKKMEQVTIAPIENNDKTIILIESFIKKTTSVLAE
tara:strand:- start:207 stop:335 length:129 start_codon:yes stop_codon:yes gene_type:complete